MYIVPRRHATSPEVYLLLGRAVLTIDAWFNELRSTEDMLALQNALSENLEGRRRAVALASSERTPPAA